MQLSSKLQITIVEVFTNFGVSAQFLKFKENFLRVSSPTLTKSFVENCSFATY